MQKKFACEKLKIEPPWWKRLFAKPTWLLSATREMPLDESTIKQTTTAFRKIAAECNGQYTGWEVDVMGENLNKAQFEHPTK